MSGKAPGKHFREGIGLIDLIQKFPDDATAEAWFEKNRWGEAGKPSHCPKCGSTEKLNRVPSRKSTPYWCGACRSNFSVRVGTVMQRSHIPLQKWAIGIYLFSVSLKGVSSMRLHRDLKITQKSAYFMGQRLREAWSESLTNMSGPLEVDETFVGGKERNKHSSKKLRAGRGGVGKAIVVGAKDRATNAVSAAVVENTDAETLQDFVADHAADDATIPWQLRFLGRGHRDQSVFLHLNTRYSTSIFSYSPSGVFVWKRSAKKRFAALDHNPRPPALSLIQHRSVPSLSTL